MLKPVLHNYFGREDLAGLIGEDDEAAPAPEVLEAGILSFDPAGDRGAANDDGITNETQPAPIFDFATGTAAGDEMHFWQKTGAGAFTDVAQVTLTQNQIDNIDPVVPGLSALTDEAYQFKFTVDNGNGEGADSNTVSWTVDTSLGTLSASVGSGNVTYLEFPFMTVDLSSASPAVGMLIEHRDVTDGAVYFTHTVNQADIDADAAIVDLTSLTKDTYDGVLSMYDDSNNLSEALAVEFTVGEITDVANLALLIDPSDISSLFQNVAGSTAVTAAGQNVGYAADLSGDSFDLTATADDTTRPGYIASFAPALRFDGTNDKLRRTSSLGIYNAGESSIFMALRFLDASTNVTLLHEGASSQNNVFYGVVNDTSPATTANEFIRNDAGTSESVRQLDVTNAFDGTDNVFALIDDGANVTGYLDDASTPVDTASYTRSGTHTPNQLSLGSFLGIGAAGHAQFDLYHLAIVNQEATTAERTNIMALQGEKIFHPLDLSGLELLLDASDISSLFQTIDGSTTAVASDADPVGYWYDQTANSIDFAALGNDTTRPTYGTTDYPHVLGDGSNDLMVNVAAALDMYAYSGLTIVAALEAESGMAQGDFLFGEGNSSDADTSYSVIGRGQGVNANNTGFFIRSDGGVKSVDTNAVGEPDVLTDENPHVYTVIDTGSQLQMFNDAATTGATIDYTRSGTFTLDDTALFAVYRNSTAALHANVRIAALAVFSRVLNVNERRLVTRWMAAKQGRTL